MLMMFVHVITNGLLPTVTKNVRWRTHCICINNRYYGNQQTFSFEYKQGVDLSLILLLVNIFILLMTFNSIL